MTPIAFDDAFNFQVARSLAEKFSYQSQYVPTEVYYGRITTNGPIQYGMAAMLKLFGLDLGRSLTLGLVGGLMALSVYRFSVHSFILYCLLLLLWPLFALSHAWFCGEILTITMMVTGIHYWEQWRARLQSNHDRRLDPFSKAVWSDTYLWVSGIAFGVAIATKLLSILGITLFVFCLSMDTKRFKPTNYKAAIIYALPAVAIATFFFAMQFSVSVLHSSGNITSILPAIVSFIKAHIWQADLLKTQFGLREAYIQPYEIPIIVVLVLSACMLIRENPTFILLALCLAALILIFHFNQRRMLPLTISTMLLAMRPRRRHTDGDKKISNKIFPALLVCSTVILLVGSVFARPPLYLAEGFKQFSLTGAATNAAYISQEQGNFPPELLPTLKKLNGPIFTSGWWQFPEISLRAGLAFYNRFADENRGLLTAPGATLLFSRKNSEDTASQETMCGKVIFQDRDLVLCEYHPAASPSP